MWIGQIKVGVLSFKKVKRPGWYITWSILIYALYFLMTYSVFKAFEPTSLYGIDVGLSVLVMGSVGMVLPVQGGIGTYHYFVIETLKVYGLALTPASVFALVLHGSTSLFMIFFGIIAMLLLPPLNRRWRALPID